MGGKPRLNASIKRGSRVVLNRRAGRLTGYADRFSLQKRVIAYQIHGEFLKFNSRAARSGWNTIRNGVSIARLANINTYRLSNRYARIELILFHSTSLFLFRFLIFLFPFPFCSSFVRLVSFYGIFLRL